MKNHTKLFTSAILKAIPAIFGFTVILSANAAPFGNEKDISDAADVWKASVEAGFVGENSIVTRPYKGAPPHGLILELMEKTVTINGVKGALVIKKNYGGNGLTIDDVIGEPDKYLKAVTIMFQREPGYDAENKNWFYGKYSPDGSLQLNPKKMKLAGRVAKGAPTGCIACHIAAPGGDFIYNHDRYK
jgi:hypothetical protein